MQEQLGDLCRHIEDLRSTILRTLIIVGMGFLILLLFYQPILQFLTVHSSLKQLENGLIKQKVQTVRVINQSFQDQLFKLPPHSYLISNLFPIEEGSLFYRLSPGQVLLYEESIQTPLLIMGPIEGVVLVFKVCFWLSIALTSPLWGWQWLQFVLPGLKEQERTILFPFLLCSLICLFLGISFAYYITLPVANQYLFLFNNEIGQNNWTLNAYINYTLFLCFGHAVAAELVLLLLTFVHFRILSLDWLIAKRRYMIVLAFILGALLTPPDILTQFFLAIPLIGGYELTICYAKWIQRLSFKEFKGIVD